MFPIGKLMKIKIQFFTLVLLLSAAAFASAQAPLTITVDLDPAAGIASKDISGRLIVFMKKDDGKPTDGFGTDLSDPNAVFLTAREVIDLAAPVRLTAEDVSFPASFTSAPAGEYLLFALLDRDHSYTYSGPGAGDIYSKVVKVTLPAGEAKLSLSGTVPKRNIPAVDGARVVEFDSPLLSRFWGRPIKMEATVVLPPSYDKSKDKFPVVYSIHGYGGTHLSALRQAEKIRKEMSEGKRPEMIWVFLNGHFSLGHHAFADSANNGPWGTALVNEFIPHLEKQFRMDAKPSGRLLTGHSSGGWSSMWVMVTHPDFFGGTWSTSPDSLDFRNFTGPDLTTDTNAFSRSAKDFPLVRMDGKDLMSVRQYAQQEWVTGTFGGQFASFNAVFSPKGPDGRPLPLFNVVTGDIDPQVAKAWEKYDVSRKLRDNWKTLGPKLKGKLHIYMGGADTFHLDEPLRVFEAEMKKLGSDARIEFLAGRTHFDLFKDGLNLKIEWEMYKAARPKAKLPAGM